MENENEHLDWGNDEEEPQHSYRRASHDYSSRREASADAEGPAEDTISLGDEDEDGYYFQRDDTQRGAYSANISQELTDRHQSPTRRGDSLGANDQPRFQQEYRDGDRFERSASRLSDMRQESPGPQTSRNPSSPNHTTRLKHALPQKPVPAKVPYLPPSHPSIVAATSMTDITPRDASRDSKKMSGVGPAGNPDLSPDSDDLPPGWERRYPREGGKIYYYNRDTHRSTWTHPVSNIPSSSSGQICRRAHSGGSSRPYMTSSDSNMHQTQPLRIERGPHVRADHTMEHVTRKEAFDRQNLSYNDRHYRPNGEPPAPVVHDAYPASRIEAVGGQYPTRPRRDKSPPPSPPHQRRRARSISPPSTIRMPPPPLHPRNQEYPPRRDHHTSRERHEYTNPDPVMPRDVDMLPPDRWIPSHLPPTEFDRPDRVSHKPPHRVVDVDRRVYDQPLPERSRPPLRRAESSRGPLNDREPIRHSDAREPLNGFISVPRQYPRERETARDYPAYREPAPVTGPTQVDRKERPPRFDRSASSNGPPPNVGPPSREPFNSRPRDYESRPPPIYDDRTQRDYERPRRDIPADPAPVGRHLPDYPPRNNIHPAPDRGMRYPDTYERPPHDDAAQISQRKRQPLPPQTTTFLSAPLGRDPPPHAFPSDSANRSPVWANSDDNLPRRPKNDGAKERLDKEATTMSRSGPPPPSNPSYERRNNEPKPQDRGRQEYAQRPPRLDTRMDIDPRDPVDVRRPTSPRGMRSAWPRPEGADEFVGGPRSARSAQTPTDRQPFYNQASIVPPPNSRYDNGMPAGFSTAPSQHGAHHDDRRYNDNREGYRDTRPSNGYLDRGLMPPRRDYPRGRPDVNNQPSPAVSGTNNVPMGTRRNPLPMADAPPPLSTNGISHKSPPQASRFNPDARPPSSTLIRPAIAPEPKLAQDSRPFNLPVADEPRRASPPPVKTQRTDASISNQLSTLDAEKSKRRVSRFSPLIPKPEMPQGQTVAQTPTRPTEDSGPQHGSPPPISREPSATTERRPANQSVDQRSFPDGRRSPQDDARPRDTDKRDTRNASGPSFDDGRVKTPPAALVTPTESGGLQRSRPKWSEQMANVPASEAAETIVDSSLSRRIISERPPRHRKYSTTKYIASEEMGSVDTVSHIAPVSQETMSFKDRLDSKRAPPVTLLDRLSSAQDSIPLTETSDAQPQSLRDRLVPSKRDREDLMMDAGDSGPLSYEGDDGGDNKRTKRRNTKGKRGGRR